VSHSHSMVAHPPDNMLPTVTRRIIDDVEVHVEHNLVVVARRCKIPTTSSLSPPELVPRDGTLPSVTALLTNDGSKRGLGCMVNEPTMARSHGSGFEQFSVQPSTRSTEWGPEAGLPPCQRAIARLLPWGKGNNSDRQALGCEVDRSSTREPCPE
jgi:hypothetical protein